MPTGQGHSAAPTKKMTIIKPPAIHIQCSYLVLTTKKCYSPNLYSPFFRTLPSILSEVLYHLASPITSRIGARQSDLCQV